MPKLKKGEKIKLGKHFPERTCDGCGETKSVRRFPKRSGFYKKYKPLDVRRYDNQCKRCRKPARPGQLRSEVTEPKSPHGQVVKAGWKTRRKMRREERRKLNASDYKRKVREETRVQSMSYLAKRGCEECGERDPRKLEYDHKEPDDKERHVANLITDGYSWFAPVLSNEIKKCRIICASCHRVHTIKQQGYYASELVQTALGKLAARYKFEL